MELIDTPNPNAKKIEIEILETNLLTKLSEINGVESVFSGPGFTTISKNESIEWESITKDITNIFDKL